MQIPKRLRAEDGPRLLARGVWRGNFCAGLTFFAFHGKRETVLSYLKLSKCSEKNCSISCNQLSPLAIMLLSFPLLLLFHNGTFALSDEKLPPKVEPTTVDWESLGAVQKLRHQ
uniref:Uncharacterized protein n=1 Tax=Panagrellus redivivus TaxID=6233 RepID=A0A7E4ZU49_PANRE